MNFLTKFAVVIALGFTMACVAWAQSPGTHPSYVSIQMRNEPLDAQPITQSVCGGIVVDERRKLVVTAWHCVPNSQRMLGTLSINGMPARILAHAAEADIAIFKVDDLKGVKAPAFKTPQKGDIVVASAFYDSFQVSPMGPTVDRFFPPMSITTTLDWETKVMAVAQANMRTGPRFDQIQKTDFKWIVASGNPAQGFSGAPVFDRAGNFIGIISSGNGGFTNISSSENVTKLLKQIP